MPPPKSSTTSEDTPDLENGQAEKDPNTIDWDGPDDEANPQNWPSSKKWLHIVLVSLLALVTQVPPIHTPYPHSDTPSNMAPTMCAPGIASLVHDLAIHSSTLSTLAVTIYVLGLGLGPMVISPLSEVYGRLPVYHASNAVFVAFLIGGALSRNAASFMVFRFLSGCAGGTPMALGGGTIADVTSLQSRASAMGLFSLGPLTGPVRTVPSPLYSHIVQG